MAVHFEVKILKNKLIEFQEQCHLSDQQIRELIGVSTNYEFTENSTMLELIKVADLMQVPLYSLFLPTKEFYMKELTDLVKRKMFKRKMTVEKLSKILNMSPNQLNQILYDNDINITEATQLTDFFNLPHLVPYLEDYLVFVIPNIYYFLESLVEDNNRMTGKQPQKN